MAVIPNQLFTLYSEQAPITSFVLDSGEGVSSIQDVQIVQDLVPASVGLPVIYAFSPLAIDPVTKLFTPLTATWTTGVWTTNGVFAGFSLSNIPQGYFTCPVQFSGTLLVSAINFDNVSQTVGYVYTIDDLVALPNITGGLLNPAEYSGQQVLKLYSIAS